LALRNARAENGVGAGLRRRKPLAEGQYVTPLCTLQEDRNYAARDGAIAERRPAEESRREESCQSLRSWTEDRGPKDLDAAD